MTTPDTSATSKPANTFNPNDPTDTALEDGAATADQAVLNTQADAHGIGDQAQAAILGTGTLGQGDKTGSAGTDSGATGEIGGFRNTTGQGASAVQPMTQADVKDSL